jgi:hypothetical protein
VGDPQLETKELFITEPCVRGRPERRWGAPAGCYRICRNIRLVLGESFCSLLGEGVFESLEVH